MTGETDSKFKIKQFLRNYLERTERMRTLKELEEDWRDENLKQKSCLKRLSFNKIKAPARQIEIKTIEVERKKQKKKKSDDEKSFSSGEKYPRRIQEDGEAFWFAKSAYGFLL